MFDRNRLRAQMVLKNVSTKKLCEDLQINESTFYRKLQNDGSFSRQEIALIIKLLDIEHPEEIFFASELA